MNGIEAIRRNDLKGVDSNLLILDIRGEQNFGLKSFYFVVYYSIFYMNYFNKTCLKVHPWLILYFFIVKLHFTLK